ncbi:lasso peptide biosynthesis protein [Streptomyces sp. Da 82-17]|uniref:lasso peptide biosynthesis protein n=1 Tax=Streptomyces sp. Da 82-17 TaxID=3377116 RepID=UPI0038D36222
MNGLRRAGPVAEWESLLWDPGPAVPRPPRQVRLLAAGHTLRAARLLRRRGWPDAQRHLRAQRPVVRDTGPQERAAAIRLARREVLPCLTALRLADPEALCLARSYALVTYLTALGLPAEVVVARQRSSIGGRFAFHAWAELYEEVLGDIPGVRTGHTVLQRVGSERVQRAADAAGSGSAA